jgi:3-hydroxyisobutyrate dehydrogenase-like beta-hydroxyacid dehydrogenase
MKIGLVGLGKMGFNMRERLRAHGLEVIGYDPRPEVTDVGSLAELAASLEGPRVVWVMVPAGEITQSTLAGTPVTPTTLSMPSFWAPVGSVSSTAVSPVASGAVRTATA